MTERLLPGPDAGPRLTGTRQEAAGYEIEKQLASAGALRIAGVDEVGRGAWAGPVVVCAAIIDLSAPPDLPRPDGTPVRLTDSKQLTARYRQAFAEVLPDWLVSYAFGAAGPEEIDEFGMTKASAARGGCVARSRPISARYRRPPRRCWPRCTGTG